jgi:hypothetical protein
MIAGSGGGRGGPGWGALSALLLGAALALAPTAAAAADPPDKAEALKLLKQGNQLARLGDHLSALERFRSAYARFPSPNILLNLGTTLRELGRNAEAAAEYERFLADPRAEAAKKGEVTRVLGEIDRVVGRLRVEVNDPLAEVRLDGKPLEAERLRGAFRIEPGEHTVVASREGFLPAVRTLTVAPRDEAVVKLEVKPPVKPRPPPVSTTQRTVGYVVGGVGVAAVVTGAVFGVLTRVKSAAADQRCLARVACDGVGVDLGATARTFATTSTATFVIGGVALATGVTLLLTAPRAAAPPTGLVVGLTGAL